MSVSEQEQQLDDIAASLPSCAAEHAEKMSWRPLRAARTTAERRTMAAKLSSEQSVVSRLRRPQGCQAARRTRAVRPTRPACADKLRGRAVRGGRVDGHRRFIFTHLFVKVPLLSFFDAALF